MTAFYNDFDRACCAVLNEQIRSNVIAPGRVDGRSIKELTADDVKGFTQIHWFAGGGIWSLAARMAGWPDARPLWTASCPCQGESLAGKRLGDKDPRNLWPDLFRIIRAASDAGRRPPLIMGEQVAAAAGTHWLDRVASDLEDEGYAFRAIDLPACAVDAPHRRQRLYWCAVADSDSSRREITAAQQAERSAPFATERQNGGSVAYSELPQWGPQTDTGRSNHAAEAQGWLQGATQLGECDGASRGALGHSFQSRLEGHAGHVGDGREPRWLDTATHGSITASDGRNGSWWAGADWIECHDGKKRRAEPGIRLLAPSIPGRVDLWRIAGNAINAALAAEVIRALMDVLPES